MQQDEFDYIAGLLKQRSGISLTIDKTYLLESRIQPIARSHGHETVSELIKRLRAMPDPAIIHEVVQSMTTNETMFFRDNKPFERLKDKILPHFREAEPTRKHLRFWSAACSSGQEAYTISMCLQEEMLKMNGYSYDIIATDLCDKVVDKAKQGLYSQFEVQRGLPIQLLIKYFTQAPENQWRVNDNIKRMVKFQTYNLMDDYAKLGRFDVVYLRNVLIYFDEATKTQVLEKIANALNPPGFLMLGSAETVLGLTTRFKAFDNEPGVYVLA